MAYFSKMKMKKQKTFLINNGILYDLKGIFEKQSTLLRCEKSMRSISSSATNSNALYGNCTVRRASFHKNNVSFKIDDTMTAKNTAIILSRFVNAHSNSVEWKGQCTSSPPEWGYLSMLMSAVFLCLCARVKGTDWRHLNGTTSPVHFPWLLLLFFAMGTVCTVSPRFCTPGNWKPESKSKHVTAIHHLQQQEQPSSCKSLMAKLEIESNLCV